MTLSGGGIVGIYNNATGTLKIKNCINMANIDISNTILNYPNTYAGGIIACITNGNVIIENCINTGDIVYPLEDLYLTASGILGGNFIVNVSNVSITECINAGHIQGNVAGGIIGGVDGICIIEDCMNIGNIESINITDIPSMILPSAVW